MVSMGQLQSLFSQLLKQWPQAVNEQFKGHEVGRLVRQELSELVRQASHQVDSSLVVKGSVGQGGWANVPWVAIRANKLSAGTEEGIYPVYLIKADGSGFYLSLNQGTTQPKKLLKKNAGDFIQKIKAQVLDLVPDLDSWDNSPLSLAATTPTGRSYEEPNIAAKYYPVDAIPDDRTLISDLHFLLKQYQHLATLWPLADKEQVANDEKELSTKMSKVYEFDVALSKPFLLLAGISGTGKTRFIRKQAELSDSYRNNYCLVSVRPDWHEPSDLLGYISRLGSNGAEYIATDVLKFVVKAWLAIIESIDEVPNTQQGKRLGWSGRVLSEISPYWLCLDEMNLAPVEQYFADYLSVIETRDWLNKQELDTYNAYHNTSCKYVYSSEPLLKPELITQLDDNAQVKLQHDLGLGSHDEVWQYFKQQGIQIPFNLIVAGTVNMDETTHGFSRKVIDRALSIDFNHFYPNDYKQFFNPEVVPKVLSYPTFSKVQQLDFKSVAADPTGQKSVDFLQVINNELKRTPFELAYRALNELLLSVIANDPTSETELQAVWDDFLMCKVLPRIEGDLDKLALINRDGSVLEAIQSVLEQQFDLIWFSSRPDLFRKGANQPLVEVGCRSKEKLDWMISRLESNQFTSFWP